MKTKNVMTGLVTLVIANSPHLIHSHSTNELELPNESTSKHNRIISDKIDYTVTGGRGVLLVDQVLDVYLPQDKDLNISEILENNFKLRDIKGKGLDWSVVDAKTGIEKYIIPYFKKNLESCDPNSRKEVIAKLNYLKGILNELPEINKNSLRSLDDALKGKGTLSLENSELSNGDILMFISRSQTVGDYGSNSIPLIVRINYGGKMEDSKTPVIEEEIQIPYRVEPSLEIEEEKQTLHDKEEITGIVTEKILRKIKSRQPHTKKLDCLQERLEEPGQIRLIAEGLAGEEGLRGMNLGVGYKYFSVLGGFLRSNNQLVNEVTVPLSNGRIGYGTRKKVDPSALKFGVELDSYPIKRIVLGAAFNKGNYTDEVKESILSSQGEVIKQNTFSRSKKEGYMSYYLGFKIPIGNKTDIRVTGGYNLGRGPYGSLGISQNLGRTNYPSKTEKSTRRVKGK